MVKVRNAIAHGRITCQKKFIWPLPPFFSLAKDSYENIEFLYFLTADMISRYIGMECWDKEWNEAKSFLMPPEHVWELFFDGTIDFKDKTEKMLVEGNKYNITWKTLFSFYVKNPEGDNRKHIENLVKDAFLFTMIDEQNAPDIFNISLIFADSEEQDIKDKAIDNIKLTIRKGWYGWSNFKDAYSYLEFYSVKVSWFKTFIDNREYL